ncbi:hypothetical protein CLV65_0176 [Pseudoscardovia suis]|uniref:Uncharacterized protein n=1 Tax=Pseudoscardovia suis TaxID=987063 RepID=A0A261EYI7_9BIFI|nr:hypothetical protein PSSU_0712 [Pseudoscardovia suis]PJJ69473.1 hypothetical protein CLV65_0176 [Pseudoscardovia suis]
MEDRLRPVNARRVINASVSSTYPWKRLKNAHE